MKPGKTIDTPEKAREMAWLEFYESRIASSDYKRYFEKKYQPFLDMIVRNCNGLVFEIGCGIGSVSNALLRRQVKCLGIDLCPQMVEAANRNVEKAANRKRGMDRGA